MRKLLACSNLLKTRRRSSGRHPTAANNTTTLSNWKRSIRGSPSPRTRPPYRASSTTRVGWLTGHLPRRSDASPVARNLPASGQPAGASAPQLPLDLPPPALVTASRALRHATRCSDAPSATSQLVFAARHAVLGHPRRTTTALAHRQTLRAAPTPPDRPSCTPPPRE